MAKKYVSVAEKGQTFNSFVSRIPMITLDKLTGSENYQSWADSVDLWFIGNGCKNHLTTTNTSIPEDKRTQWKKTDALLCNILRQSIDVKTLYNIGTYKTCYTLWNQVKKLYNDDIQRLYRVISSIANLKQLGIDISSYGGRMSAFKDELISILPKSTNTYSQCTWLFLMKTRADLFSIFQKFHAKIHTQFNTSIRILRSDNAKEYFSTPLSSFMSSHGILHHHLVLTLLNIMEWLNVKTVI